MQLNSNTPLGESASFPDLDGFRTIKGDSTIAVCIPARDEAATIARIVEICIQLLQCSVVDEVLVVDDHSNDDTAKLATLYGARVISNEYAPGKGEALRTATEATESDYLVFLDADVTNFTSSFVTNLASPILTHPAAQMVKANYERPFAGTPGQGGRVTEILAKPLLERFFPQLADVGQPLSGECAIRRSALSALALSPGYGIEIGLLIDLYRKFGRAAILEAPLGERIHRNRPLEQLHSQTRDVLDAVLTRTLPREGSLCRRFESASSSADDQ
jgi:glucosyl-3-phosphoglycerate synthase